MHIEPTLSYLNMYINEMKGQREYKTAEYRKSYLEEGYLYHFSPLKELNTSVPIDDE